MIKSLQNKHDGFRLSLYLLNNVKFKLPFVNNSFLPNWAGQKSMKGSTFPFIFMQKKKQNPGELSYLLCIDAVCIGDWVAMICRSLRLQCSTEARGRKTRHVLIECVTVCGHDCFASPAFCNRKLMRQNMSVSSPLKLVFA